MAEQDLCERVLRLTWAAAPKLWLLRLRRDCAMSRERAASALGIVLPDLVGHSSDGSFCLAPGEWLLEGDREGQEERLLAVLSGEPALLVDVGPGTMRLDIEGPAAPDILNKGCSLDLHRKAFPMGRWTRTLLAGVVVTLGRGEEDTFRLYFDRSLSDWLGDWFDEAGQEYRVERVER